MLEGSLYQRDLFKKRYKITDQAIFKATDFENIEGLNSMQVSLIYLGLQICMALA